MVEAGAYLDLFLLSLYVLTAVAIGWRNTCSPVTSLNEYAVGYASISTPVLICGILATSIGAGTIVEKVNLKHFAI